MDEPSSDGSQVMPLMFRLASRNLFHDRLRFIATIVGIVFSIVLVTVQMGLYVGFGRMVTTMIDHATADLWVMPRSTKCFEDPSLLDDRQRFRALAVDGVAEAAPLVIGFAQWRLPGGGTTPVFIVGSELRGLIARGPIPEFHPTRPLISWCAFLLMRTSTVFVDNCGKNFPTSKS